MIPIFKGDDGKTHLVQRVSVAGSRAEMLSEPQLKHTHQFSILPFCAQDTHEVPSYEHAVDFDEFLATTRACAECAKDYRLRSGWLP